MNIWGSHRNQKKTGNDAMIANVLCYEKLLIDWFNHGEN